MKVALIAAVSRNGVIGHANDLLWRLPEDMKFFRQTTTGHPVIMGRKTWESIPQRFRPLSGRTNIVVTRQRGWRDIGAVVVHSFEAAVEAALESISSNPHGIRAFVIGGAELYALAMPHADELLLTEIDRDFEGDARFPDWRREDFVEVLRERHPASDANGLAFAFVTYRRVASH